MKKLLTFTLFCYSLVIVSCSKSLNTPDDALAETASTNTKSSRISSTISDLLTSQTWLYYEYFLDFNVNPTKLVWKTNRSTNSLNLASNRVTYFSDNTFTEIDQNGIAYSGYWSLLNNNTEVQVSSSRGTFTSTIQQLTSNRYEWLDSSTGRYGILVPQNQAIDTTGGKRALLTSRPWTYTEYFSGFDQATPSLIWKTDKTNSPLNLTSNRVKYNTDGSYTEIDQNGITHTGNWEFLNNDTQVKTTSSQGTFISTIKVLSTDRYEWLSTLGSAYGEMEHPAQ
ncbi:hypothetical protein [Niastella sp. OAS944]|uniref:hypothetical protein n=1 Tax=Niastella sp. OAS944 TaxID=2664089 RepID=UPI00347BE42C|nr:hypothetical protein [Chitinophagaceae bacterium OAS944]